MTNTSKPTPTGSDPAGSEPDPSVLDDSDLDGDEESEVEGFGFTPPSVKGSMFDLAGGVVRPGPVGASLTEDTIKRLSGGR